MFVSAFYTHWNGSFWEQRWYLRCSLFLSACLEYTPLVLKIYLLASGLAGVRKPKHVSTLMVTTFSPLESPITLGSLTLQSDLALKTNPLIHLVAGILSY